MAQLSEYDKGLKDAVKQLTAAMHAVDEAREKLEQYGVTAYYIDTKGAGKSFPPSVAVNNGIKELAEIMGVTVKDKHDWAGRIDGLECVTHGVKFSQKTLKEVEHYEPRREEKKDAEASD